MGVRQICVTDFARVDFKPIHFLGEAFEGRRGSMDAIIAGVGLGRETKLFPSGVDQAADRVRRSSGWVSWTKKRAAEIGPSEVVGVPFDDKVVDRACGYDGPAIVSSRPMQNKKTRCPQNELSVFRSKQPFWTAQSRIIVGCHWASPGEQTRKRTSRRSKPVAH